MVSKVVALYVILMHMVGIDRLLFLTLYLYCHSLLVVAVSRVVTFVVLIVISVVIVV